MLADLEAETFALTEHFTAVEFEFEWKTVRTIILFNTVLIYMIEWQGVSVNRFRRLQSLFYTVFIEVFE